MIGTSLVRAYAWAVVIAGGIFGPAYAREKAAPQNQDEVDQTKKLHPDQGLEKNGFRLLLSAKKKTVTLGEPIQVTVSLQNVTESEIEFRDLLGRDDQLFIVRGEATGNIPLREGAIGGPISLFMRRVPAGGKDTYQRTLTNMYRLDKVDIYTIVAGRPAPIDAKTAGYIISNAITIEIVAEAP